MKKISKFLATVMTLALVLSLCPASFAVAATKTTIKTKSITLEVGKTAKIELSKVKATTYSFTSSDKAVATVSKSGEITAVKEGTAKINVKKTANKSKKSVKVGTISVTVTEAEGVPEAKTTLDANSYYVDLSTVAGSGTQTYDKASDSAKIENSMFSFALKNPLVSSDTITVTVKGKYTGSKGFRSWVVDNETANTTMSDVADASKFPTTPGKFTATYKLTAIGDATRLFFKGPSWQDANVDSVTITQIIITK